MQPLLESILVSESRTDENRLAALDIFVGGLGRQPDKQLLQLTEQIDDGAVLAAIFRKLGGESLSANQDLLLDKLLS